MPRWIRLSLMLGLALTLVGLVGLAATIGQVPGQGPQPSWFVPFYVAGSLVLVGSGVAWLVSWTRRPPPH